MPWSTAQQSQEVDFAVIALDITGAFPNVNRQHLRVAVQKYLPPFLPIFDLLYGRATTHDVLTKDKGVIELLQATGITQGNELSTLFFSVYMKQIFDQHFAEFNMLTMARQYIDDVFLLGPSHQLQPVLERMKQHFGTYDLKLNMDKCKLWMPLQTDDATAVRAQRSACQRGCWFDCSGCSCR